MEFRDFRDRLIEHFNEMTKDADMLFETSVDKDALWEVYLSSFPEGTNDIFRERREHDCSCCRQFIRNIGGAVVIKDNKVETIWNFETGSNTYQKVADELDKFVRNHIIEDGYVGESKRVGTKENFEENEDGKTIKWEHFYLDLPEKFVNKTRKSVGEIKGNIRSTREVFYRSLNEIDEDSVETVLELVASDSLYRGEEWREPLKAFLGYLKDYNKLEAEQERINFSWENANKAGVGVAKIRNHSIGVLLCNISAGMELNEAVGRYENIVAPTNYKRPKAVYTKKMVEAAKKTVVELGYSESLGRRFAKLDDITANNILFLNRDTEAIKRVQLADEIFGKLEEKAKVTPKKFDRVEEIKIGEFVSKVLPKVREMEVYMENRHSGNLVSLIAPKDPQSKTMFKWQNNFSWAYSGNVTDSMKERVKAAGGKVEGDLRFSIQWNDLNEYDGNDLDAHCIEPGGYEIYYINANTYSPSKGILDIDIITPHSGKPAVENIIYASRNSMRDGVYKLFVHCFTNRGGAGGFRAEVEFDGQIYSFDYTGIIKQSEDVEVAEVTLKNGEFSITSKLPKDMKSREYWGVKTNDFVPVSVMMYSPNYWDEDKQGGTGNRHYFFMLQGCKNPDQPNGFYNEFLRNELNEHRKVFEALGAQMRVEPDEDQLSGLGFSSTKRNELIVKVKGNTERVLKLKF